MNEDQNTDNSRDYVGKIVTAECESVDDRRVMLKFEDSERAFVERGEWKDADIGQKREIYIEGATKSGLWVGSVDKIDAVRLWNRIEKIHRDGSDIEVEVIAAERSGLLCDICSLACYMPRREIENSPLNFASYIGKKMAARVIKFSAADGKIIVSHRAAVAQSLREEREKFLTELAVDQTYDAIVKQIMDYGVFADIGAGVEGLIHRSNLSWGNEDPAGIVSVGDRIKVIILAVEKGRISLGHKQLVEDSWVVNAEKLRVGDVVEGKVTTFANFGAFVRLDNGMEGLVHNSELSWDDSVRNAKQVLKLNDSVRVRIMDIDKERRRLRLSIRRVDGDPWAYLKNQYPTGTRVKLRIVGIADFGLFVDMGNGIRGLIHKNDLSWSDEKIVLNEAYHEGDEVECVVLDIDTERERASLGIKQLTGDPWAEFMAKSPLGRSFDAEIVRIARFGAFASIDDTKVEGLIHISELSENRVENVGAVVKVGQKVTVTVVTLDEKRRRIGLSMIAEPFDPEAQKAEEVQKLEDEPKSPTMADIFPERLKRV